MVRVLIVEDDAAIRETLSAILRGDDVEVTLCDGATQAAKLIPRGNYDVIITDMRMETPTSGADVIPQDIKQRGRGIDIHGVRFTVHLQGDITHVWFSLRIGVDTIIV